MLSNSTLPTGVVTTDLTAGPQLGLTASNIDYPSAIYSVFTDFGTPGAGGLAGTPGMSGVQGLDGEFPIGVLTTAGVAATTALTIDQEPEVSSLFRPASVSVAFDPYGYFSQGFTLTTSTTNATTGTNNGDLIDTNAGDFTISTPRDARQPVRRRPRERAGGPGDPDRDRGGEHRHSGHADQCAGSGQRDDRGGKRR